MLGVGGWAWEAGRGCGRGRGRERERGRGLTHTDPRRCGAVAQPTGGTHHVQDEGEDGREPEVR